MLVKDSTEADEACGWLVFEANPDDREKSYMTIMFNCNVTRFVECDMPVNAIFEEVSASLRRLYISRNNLFHAVLVLAELHERTCREHLPIRRKLNNAIHKLRRKKLATSVPVC
ncbi:hypothetical protein Ae201684_007615 [Aphanomyces euteiches]|uniref:Uncharacterized protein n=1 Tax=Aphanomyces euteiches TaxID=100861 RepID=A0A6G0X7Q3_9STRA|nr:hypothetical protein Ae201684_007615 [Aphanomyces euteiches]